MKSFTDYLTLNIPGKMAFVNITPMVAEAVRQGPDGLVADLRVAMRPWGVDLASITVPTTVWQGDHDRSIPAAWGELLASSIPQARLRLRPGEGHLMIAATLEAVLQDLLARAG